MAAAEREPAPAGAAERYDGQALLVAREQRAGREGARPRGGDVLLGDEHDVGRRQPEQLVRDRERGALDDHDQLRIARLVEQPGGALAVRGVGGDGAQRGLPAAPQPARDGVGDAA